MKLTEYEKRVRQLEREGCTRSDAQGVADAELMRDPSKARAGSVLPPLTLTEARAQDAQHTPGPIYFDGWYPPRETGLMPSVKATWDGRSIQMFTQDLEQGERDMKVLIAAPELLELLTDVGQWLEMGLARGEINRGTANRDGDLVSQIRTAIAKAKGRK